jgi:hypothetical protein
MPWPTRRWRWSIASTPAGRQVKWLLIGLLWVVAIASQNILPIHIAFIPLLVPPLLYVLTKLQLDRRLIACVMTFGLITPYMFLPVGFGNIFLNEILLANVARSGVDISRHQCHPRHGHSGAGHGGRPAGGVYQLSQEARLRPGKSSRSSRWRCSTTR